ncbi:MAG: class I SAM-dependent methyltransferase [Ignavibacteria bacterium]|nr:class I SAM-dependent methyltransferase [Ignavibacteria bacterium]
MKLLLKNLFKFLGYDLVRRERNLKTISKKKSEGFPEWLEKSRVAGMDVNDYINSKMGSPAQTLERIFTPYLSGIKSPVVIEIGTGTGRWSKDIAQFLKRSDNWKLYLVDHSQWIITFLKQYFKNETNIIPLLNNGMNLPKIDKESVDIIFSTGTFIEFSLQQIYSFCRDFDKVVKRSGYVIFNFIDPDSSDGWEHLKNESFRIESCFSYHTSSTLDKVLKDFGFTPVMKEVIGKSKYAVFKKN